MTIEVFRNRAGIRWNSLKYLDPDTKLDIIAMLTQSLKSMPKRKKVSAKKFYGIWTDDGMTADEFVTSLKAERKFNQDIVEL